MVVELVVLSAESRLAAAFSRIRTHVFAGHARQQIARIILAACASLAVTGCLPGDDAGQTDGASSAAFPVSNRADKSDREDIADRTASAEESDKQYRVATTATVVPTSAPASVSREPGSNPPKVKTVPVDKALNGFFKALAAIDSGERKDPVTIVHIGNQHFAADRFASYLRTQLQTRFGDAGRGFMAPGVFRVADARVEHDGDWRIASSAAGDPGPYGLTGVRLIGKPGASMTMSFTETRFDWAEITFATGPETGSAHVGVDGRGDTVDTRTPQPNWQRIRINASGTALKVRAEGKAPVHLLSWAVMSDKAGVRYTNLGLPGATMLTSKRWTREFVAANLEHLAPDLIVIGYGTNESFDDSLDVADYAAGAREVIKTLKDAAPTASIVVIGPPDVAYMPSFASRETVDACRPLSAEERADYADLIRDENPRLGRWHPPVTLRPVRNALRRAAGHTGAYFWDWSAMMGGACSIHSWVHAKPALATSDHRHFTAAGARKSARAFFHDLMRAYERRKNVPAKAAKAAK